MINNIIASQLANLLNDRLTNYAYISSANNVIKFDQSGRIIAQVVDNGKIHRLYTTEDIEKVIKELEDL